MTLLDKEAIRAGVAAVFVPGSVLEVRILKTPKKTVSGYFNSAELAVEELEHATRQYNGSAAFYYTLNPINPVCHARAANRLRPFADCTSTDADVVSRQNLLIDVDPKRPAGVSSTDGELQLAIAKRNAIVAALTAQGWPAPLRAMSGNGAHALYRINLPNTSEARDLVRGCLGALDRQFSDTDVEIDTSVYNAARIVKAYGTIARKGDDTTDRPHRRSFIEDRPALLEVVTVEQLERLANQAPGTLRPKGPPSTYIPRGRRVILDYQHEFERRGDSLAPLRDGKHAVRCPWHESHSGDSGPSQTVIFEPTSPGGLWGFKCQHQHCAHRTNRDIWELFRPPLAAKTNELGRGMAAPGPIMDTVPRVDHDGEVSNPSVISTLADTLHDVEVFIRQYVVLSTDAAVLMALWVVETYAIDAFEYVAYLHIKSPMPECGKTRCLEVLEALVKRPWHTGRVTAAVLMRKMDAEHPVLLLDESDAAFNGDQQYAEALRGILNTGFQRSGTASACVGQGANISYKDFTTFGPKAIAGIGRLPSTVESRSVPIALRRRTKAEPVAKWRRRDAWEAAAILRAQLADVLPSETLRTARPQIPEGLSDRAEDVLEPLFAIADHAGGEWPERARAAAVALMGYKARTRLESDQNIGLELLTDIRSIFAAQQHLSELPTAEIIKALIALEDRRWLTFTKGEKPITPHRLSRLLKDFDVHPAGDLRIGDKVLKGYRLAAFADAFARYLPIETQQRNKPNESGPDTAKAEAQHDAVVADSRRAVSPDRYWDCCDVADSIPDPGEGGLPEEFDV